MTTVDYIQSPSKPLQLRRAEQIWSTTFTHPYAIGVIDETLIPMQEPQAAFHPDEYILSQGISRHQYTCPM